MNASQRPEKLVGPTYRATLGDRSRMYITVNEFDGEPVEVFVRYDDPALYEWIAALTVLITRLLRAGQSLEDIAADLEEIHGPESSHIIPGTSRLSPSIVARIGRVFRLHHRK